MTVTVNGSIAITPNRPVVSSGIFLYLQDTPLSDYTNDLVYYRNGLEASTDVSGNFTVELIPGTWRLRLPSSEILLLEIDVSLDNQTVNVADLVVTSW